MIHVKVFVTEGGTDRQTDRQTDGRMGCRSSGGTKYRSVLTKCNVDSEFC